jgi:hypothetical protein
MPEHVSRPWASDAATWMENGTGCDCIAADRRLNENESPMSPSDGINFALNFDVVFQPVLGTTLRFAETSDTHPSAASLPHPFALS